MNSADCTILISTSPIPSHPSTALIEEVIRNARYWLPKAPVVIMADGVWSGVSHRQNQYREYLNNLQKLNIPDVVCRQFSQHSSQAKMTRTVLEEGFVNTRYLLFNEHDISLRTDISFDWESIFEVLQYKRADVVRLCGFCEGIHPEHQCMCYGETYWKDSHFYYTRQWSQWPHVSTPEFYLNILRNHFQPEEIMMIEERMHGVCQIPRGSYIRIWEYLPLNEDKRCFTHREGRAGDPCHWQI